MSERPQVQFSNGPTSFKNRLKRLVAITALVQADVGLTQMRIVARRFWPSQGPPPFRPQYTRPLRVALVEKTGRRHPVGPEAADVLAQLAPGDQMTDGFHIANGHRPDGAFTLTTLLVAVA